MNTLVTFTLLAACSNDGGETITSSKPTAQEVLKEEPNADIIQINGTIYKTNIKRVDDLKVTKDKEIAIIQKTSKKDIKDGTASKLRVKTKIFSTKEQNDVVIAEINGKIKKYIALAEG